MNNRIKMFVLLAASLFLLLCVSFLIPGISFAYFSPEFPGSARAAGEGGAFIGVIDNSNSVFYNPAAVEFESDQNYLLGYKQGVDNTNGYSFSFSKKIFAADVIAIGIDNIDSSGILNEIVALGYGRRLNEEFTVGISAKKFRYNSSSFSGDVLSADLGLIFHSTENLSVGFVYKNFVKTNFRTSAGSEESLPSGIALGFSYIYEESIFDRLDMTLKYEQLKNYSCLGFDMGLSLKLFSFVIWKGYSYLNVEVSSPKDYPMIWGNDRGPWKEALGIGWPVSEDYMIEYSNFGDGLNVLSFRYKI